MLSTIQRQLNRPIKIGPRLDELTRFIGEYSESAFDINGNIFPDLLDHIGSNEYFVPLIRSILNSPQDLKKIASQSYKHVNHFDKIVLVDSNQMSAFRLTIHFWCPPFSSEQVNEELIHAHRFNFWSRILLGTLRSECFTESDQGDEYQAYRYFPSLGDNYTFQDFYQFEKYVRLCRETASDKRFGEIYFLSAPTIHRIKIDPHFICCTLVLRGPRLCDYSVVYNTCYPTADTRINNQMFTPPELETKLHVLINNLQSDDHLINQF